MGRIKKTHHPLRLVNKRADKYAGAMERLKVTHFPSELVNAKANEYGEHKTRSLEEAYVGASLLSEKNKSIPWPTANKN